MSVGPEKLWIRTKEIEIPSDWPSIGIEAFQGPVGDVVKANDRYSEADPAAVLISLLAHAGALVGKRPHFVVSSQEFRSNIFTLLVGPTSLGRKGTAGEAAKQLIGAGNGLRELGGLVSGEAIVARLGDEEHLGQPALIIEEEFARFLEVAGRNGSTLSHLGRQLFDGRPLCRLSVDQEMIVEDYHAGCIGHITPEELLLRLSAADRVNGLANRFLMVASHSRKRVVWFGKRRDDGVNDLLERAMKARERDEVRPNEEVREFLAETYLADSNESPNPLLARRWSHAMRLVLVFALMDGAKEIGMAHVTAALAMVDYAEATVRYVFPDTFKSSLANRLLQIVQEHADDGVTLSQISKRFANHIEVAERDEALRELEDANLIRCMESKGGGRSARKFVPVTPEDEEAA